MVNPTNRPRIPAPPGHYGCTKCGQVKPLSEFYQRKGGNAPHCKLCRRAAMLNAPLSATIEARFWPKVNKDGPVFEDKGPCWLWTARKNLGGYGVLWTGGRPATRLAHRISLELAGRYTGDPDVDLADHLCKNTLCVNPDHLRIVTALVNAVENVDSPHAVNARKTECVRGHPLSGSNLAIVRALGRYGRIGTARTCLTCYPTSWMWAVEERVPPPRARGPWRGPFKP